MNTEVVVQEKSKQMKEIVDIALSTQIQTIDQYEKAIELLKSIKSRAKEHTELRFSMTKPIDESKKRIMDLFRPTLDSLERAESYLKQICMTFQTDQERLRLEEEMRLQEAARKEEEKKRKQLEVRAIKAEEKGDVIKAEQLKDAAESLFIPVPQIESNMPKQNGFSIRSVWKWRVTNETKIPKQFFILNEKEIDRIAKAGIISVMNIPGIEFFEEKIAAVRSFFEKE